MLLILSEKGDLSTNDIIDWLKSFNIPFIRLNTDEPDGIVLYAEHSSDGLKCSIKTNQHFIRFDEITCYWYRRGGIPQFKIPAKSIDGAFEEKIAAKIKDYLNLESRYLYTFFHRCLDKIPGKIGSFEKAGVNKLHVLEMAHKVGLDTPQWCVSMKKDSSLSFINQFGGQVITKGIWESLIASTDDSGYSTYTEQVTQDEIVQFPDNHFPSLLQKNIPKKFEIRSFYFLGQFWSMAIFSQKDQQTAIDFRKYNDDKPNRNVPFQLPQEIEEKLRNLMDLIELETGSIDIIVDESDRFVFLEVNPVGQFGMTSSPCNYALEKKIATHFLQTMQQHEKIQTSH